MMDESKDHELRVSNASELTVVEGEGDEIEERRVCVSEKVVTEEERGGGGCESGDVMVEVLGCEVFVNSGKREDLGEEDYRVAGTGRSRGEADTSIEVDDSFVILDRDSERLQGSVASYGGENVSSGNVDKSVSESGILLDDDDDGETEDVDNERVVEIGVERKSDNECRVIETELAGSENGLYEDVVSHNLEARSNNNEIENGVQDSRSSVMSVADGNKLNNDVKEEGEEKGVKVVEVASVVSETKEEVISEEGYELTINFDAGFMQHGNGEDGFLVKHTSDFVIIKGVQEQASNTEHIASTEANSHGDDEMANSPDPITSSPLDKHVKDAGKIQKLDEKLNSGSVPFETEVPDVSVAASPTEGLVGNPKQDGKEESEGYTTHGRPLFPDESLVDGANQEKRCAPDTLVVNASTMEGVAQFDSNMEDIQEVQDNAYISQQFESPDQEGDEEFFSDSETPQSNDENAVLEGRIAHELPHWPDESFVEDVDQGNIVTPVTSPIDENAMVDSDIDDSQDEAEVTEEFESPDEQEVDEESVSYSTKSRAKEEENARHGYGKSGRLVKGHRVSYWLPPENEGEFSVFDLVWGKVKSHPWWPGQIFRPFDSSELAKKYFRKDCYLVAYFGDKSFAWNEGSVLKPFFKHFSQEEKQSNSEPFQNAVSCALEEVCRRVELGLSCSCISEEVQEKIKYQMVDNGGIREESSKREGVDWSTGIDHFQPEKLFQYMKTLALSPNSRLSRLDLIIAKAQMTAFYRLKGCDMLRDFQYYEGLMECDADTSPHAEKDETELVNSVGGSDRRSKLKGPRRRKHNLKDIVYERRKEKTLTELMGDSVYYFDGDFDSHEEDEVTPTTGTKRKASLYPTDDFTGQQSTQTASPNAQQSFKVGECIRRIAGQLTGSSSVMKVTDEGSNNKHVGDDIDVVSDPSNDSVEEEIVTPRKEASLDELLSQLHLSARDPMKGYSFLPDVVGFFSKFRNLAVSTQRQRMRKVPGRKRNQPSVSATGAGAGASATFEFDDRNDSYWTDMVIQKSSEAKPSKRGRKRKEDRVLSPDTEKPLKPRKYTRKQYFHGNHESTAELPSGSEKRPEELPAGPTELVMNFSEAGSVPSEVHLNKMFRRFGPLKEPDTEIDTQSGRAKVIFKKRSDAEVAYSSATMFNIFGSTLVNYQLNYVPSVPFGLAPLPVTDGQKVAT